MSRNRYKEMGLLGPESARDRLALSLSLVERPAVPDYTSRARRGGKPTPLQKDLVRLSKRLAAMLDGFVSSGQVNLTLDARDLPSARVELVLKRSPAGPIVSWGTGSLSGNWTLGLALALMSPDAERLRRCPGCGRFFLRQRKAEHCSQRCARRVYMRRYRETER